MPISVIPSLFPSSTPHTPPPETSEPAHPVWKSVANPSMPPCLHLRPLMSSTCRSMCYHLVPSSHSRFHSQICMHRHPLILLQTQVIISRLGILKFTLHLRHSNPNMQAFASSSGIAHQHLEELQCSTWDCFRQHPTLHVMAFIHLYQCIMRIW